MHNKLVYLFHHTKNHTDKLNSRIKLRFVSYRYPFSLDQILHTVYTVNSVMLNLPSNWLPYYSIWVHFFKDFLSIRFEIASRNRVYVLFRLCLYGEDWDLVQGMLYGTKVTKRVYKDSVPQPSQPARLRRRLFEFGTVANSDPPLNWVATGPRSGIFLPLCVSESRRCYHIESKISAFFSKVSTLFITKK